MQMLPPDEERPPVANREAIKKGSSTLGTSVAPVQPRRLGCVCGCTPGEPCEYDVPAVDRYRTRLGLPPVGPNPGTCRCQRACWVGSREQGNAKFICVCREEVAS